MPEPILTKRSSRAGSSAPQAAGPKFTHRQGQFLAFLHLYRKLHRQAPAEADLVRFFRITPPAVHTMIVKLAELGLITRQPGVARSIRVILPEEEIPRLEDVEGPPW
jgi:repressor LexA